MVNELNGNGRAASSRKIVGIAAMLVAGLTGTVVLSGEQGRHVISSAMADPLSVLTARSPGARPFGALTQTKPNRITRQLARNDHSFVPTERVLSEVRTRPSTSAAPEALAQVPQAQASPFRPNLTSPETQVASPATPSFFSGGSGLGAGPSVSGGGSSDYSTHRF